jgi:hypothetical protein
VGCARDACAVRQGLVCTHPSRASARQCDATPATYKAAHNPPPFKAQHQAPALTVQSRGRRATRRQLGGAQTLRRAQALRRRVPRAACCPTR